MIIECVSKCKNLVVEVAGKNITYPVSLEMLYQLFTKWLTNYLQNNLLPHSSCSHIITIALLPPQDLRSVVGDRGEGIYPVMS